MIYTPLRRIPIGEAVQRADGTYALRIKKPNKDEFDEISMDHLVAAVIKGTAQEKANRQGATTEYDLHRRRDHFHTCARL